MPNQKETIVCKDGFKLGLTLHSADKPKAALVIGSALGVSHAYYSKFAQFLSEHGFHVLSFDYRGTGLSADNENNIALQLADWGRQDMQAVLSRALDFKLPVYFIGHSIGGQLLPLAEHSKYLKKAIFIAASVPYWGRWDFPAKLGVFLNTRVLLPAFARILKNIPADKFGLGNLNIPSAFIKTWCQWMSTPEYFFHRNFFPEYKDAFKVCEFPKRAYCFTDDSLAPLSNVNELMRYYIDNQSEVMMRAPADYNVKAIGHSGFIRSTFKESLWQEAVDYFS